jgi:hypothetical protein
VHFERFPEWATSLKLISIVHCGCGLLETSFQ